MKRIIKRIKSSINLKMIWITSICLLIFMIVISSLNYISLTHMKEQALDVTESELTGLVEEYYGNYLDSVNIYIDGQMDSIFNELDALSNTLQTFFSNRSNLDSLVESMKTSDYFDDDLKMYDNYVQNESDEESVVFVASYMIDDGEISDDAISLIEDTKILDLILPSFIDYGVDKLQIYFQGGENREIFRLTPWSNIGEDILSVYPEIFDTPIWETFNPGLAAEWRELIKTMDPDELHTLLRVTPPVQDGLTGDLVLTMSQPLANETYDEFEGTLSYDVSIGEITSLIEDISISDTGFAFVTQSNGNVFAVNEYGQKTLGLLNDEASTIDSTEGFNRLERFLTNSSHESVKNLVMNKTNDSVLETIVIDDIEYIFASRNLYEYQSWLPEQSFFDETWQIGFLVPKEEVYKMYNRIEKGINSQVSQLILNTFIMTFVLAVVILLMIYKFNSIVTRELVELSDAANSVKRKDYDVDIEVKTDDEIGLLASAFKDMIIEIKSSFDQMESQNDMLQLEIDERIRKDRIIDYLENFDSSTDLPNKKALLNILKEMKSEKGQFVSLIVVGLDEFRKVNEAYSWTFGDRLILAIADRLSLILPDECILFKLSGDEFAFIFRDNKLKNLISIVEEVNLGFKKSFKVDDYDITIGSSLGISSYPFDTEEPTDLFKYATNAMIHAKEVNKGRYEFYSADMNDSARMRMSLLNELRSAIELDEFKLYYQPIISVETKKVTGMEALLRWNNKNLGVISPAVFIPLAEKTDLMISIGEWVLKRALIETKKIHDLGHFELMVAVNVSVMQFLDSNFISHLKDTIKEVDIDASKITIEITEGLFINDLNGILEVLNEIKKLGLSISVDDFGTGYSSLSYIKDLPLSKLKIDRSFINEIDEDMSQKLVSAIIGLAKNLNLSVVAEGIETEEQLSYIETRLCEEAQGYIFSKPLPIEEFVDYVIKNKGLSQSKQP